MEKKRYLYSIAWDADDKNKSLLPNKLLLPDNIEDDDVEAILERAKNEHGYSLEGYCIVYE